MTTRKDGRVYISVPTDPATKRAIHLAAKHGGMSTASFMRGVTLFFMQANNLTELVGRPPVRAHMRRYNPRLLPQSIQEAIDDQEA